MAPKRSTDNWQIVKNISIGPVKFGMTRAEVAKAIGSKPAAVKKPAETPPQSDDFKVGSHRVHVAYVADRAAYVEVTGDGLGGPELDGRGFLNRPNDRALTWMRERDPNVVVDGAICRSDVLGVAVLAPEGADDKIKGVAAFSDDYWSTKQ